MDKKYHTVCFPQFRAIAFLVFAEAIDDHIVVAVDRHRYPARHPGAKI